MLDALLPDAKKPAPLDSNPGLRKAWEKRVAELREARRAIERLRHEGCGTRLESARAKSGAFLNAAIEYVDHHQRGSEESRLSHALLGDGMDPEFRAFILVQEEAEAA